MREYLIKVSRRNLISTKRRKNQCLHQKTTTKHILLSRRHNQSNLLQITLVDSNQKIRASNFVRRPSMQERTEREVGHLNSTKKNKNQTMPALRREELTTYSISPPTAATTTELRLDCQNNGFIDRTPARVRRRCSRELADTELARSPRCCEAITCVEVAAMAIAIAIAAIARGTTRIPKAEDRIVRHANAVKAALCHQ